MADEMNADVVVPVAPIEGNAPMSGAVLRDRILAADDQPLVPVDVPEWGVRVWVKPMSAAQRDAFEAAVSDDNGVIDKTNFRANLVVRCVVDPETKARVFQTEDAKMLGTKNALPVGRIFDAAAKSSGLTPDDVAGLEGKASGPAEGSSTV